MKLTIDFQKALVILLSEKYRAEFICQDGFDFHPTYPTFEDWLYSNDLIDLASLRQHKINLYLKQLDKDLACLP